MAWLAPDSVLPRALRVLAARESVAGRVCVVRDLRGRVRIAAEHGTDAAAIQEDMLRELGAWFAAPVINGRGSPAHRRIAAELFRSAPDWPPDWPTQLELPDGSMGPVPKWVIGRVVLQSKESWLAATGALAPQPPRVVSFYSFKGGVGRTTTLGCVAARLATERGLRVVAVDLDLEAPGTGAFLGARGVTGVTDHILSHLATGDVGDVDPEPVVGFSNFWVVPAGNLGPGYLEKLARIDFLAAGAGATASPAEEALRALLAAIRTKLSPEIILLDSRAGLHDIGGLALHRLSHSDVLVSRANAQARAGMQVVLAAIRRFRSVEERDVRLVQTMVPLPYDSDVAQPLIRRWRRDMYDICLETIYSDLDEVPSEDQEAAHFPLLVAERAEFSRTDSLVQVAPELMPHFDPIADVVAPEPEVPAEEDD
ncbi:MAG: AAA family ATPase [Polyangiaceae bacterium]|nr:AAA family ATPase [Polyangiaceae bacterium]